MGTFGKTTVGRSFDSGMFADYKIVNSATLSVGASVTKLSLYAIPGIHSPSPQALKAVIYSDSGGSPGALVATGPEVSYSGSVNGSGWFDLPFASPVALSPGTYWLGFITGARSEGMGYVFDNVSNSRAYNANNFASGPTSAFGAPTRDSELASVYATFTQSGPPVNVSPPTISGVAQVGQTLGATTGSFSENPSAYEYQWQRCDAQGANCSAISLATAQRYTVGSADLGSTLRVSVTATNTAGSSTPAGSAQTEVVPWTTFGYTSVGALPSIFAPDRKRASRYDLPVAGSVTKLSIYLEPGWQAGQQLIEGLVYADSGDAPGALLGTSAPLTFTSTDAAGWYDMTLATPLHLAAGHYWVGALTGATSGVASFRFDWAPGSRVRNENTYASGPTDPFGAAVTDDVQMSIYATYTPDPPSTRPPADLTPPTIQGTAQAGQTLSASTGSWSESPSAYEYQWQRCDAQGANCSALALGSAQSYAVGSGDVGSTLRVSVTATNAAGSSAPTSSAQTAVVTSSGSAVSHLEYVFNDGLVSVYDMDLGQALVKTISLPQTSSGVRGVTVSPGTHMLFISYGGDGGGNGTGSVLAYDLVAEKVLWTVHLNTGIDSGAVSPDGKRLYRPTGENASSGIWNVLDTSNGAVIGTIQGGEGAHNTVASADGRYVYLGGRNYKYLDVYETATGQVREVGPLVSGVRPFTVNGSNTLAFTTATEFDGFQVSSITTGKVLFTVSFGAVPSGFPFSAPSHGISLSPDARQLYVIDVVNKEVHVYDVSSVSEGVAPTQLGVIPVNGWNGNESPCAYDCGQDGWLQHSLDGRFVYVGDSGEVIETATRKVLTVLGTLANTRKSLEIDWANGVPIATSGRLGVGHAR